MRIEEILYLCFLIVLFSFLFYPIYKETKRAYASNSFIKHLRKLEKEIDKEIVKEDRKQKLGKMLYNTVLPFLQSSAGLDTYRFKYNEECFTVTIIERNDIYQIYFNVVEDGFNKDSCIRVSSYEYDGDNILIFFVEEDRIYLETYTHLKNVYDIYVNVICTALILIYQRLYASASYSCGYPIIKGKELNSDGISVKQSDRTTSQFTGSHFR